MIKDHTGEPTQAEAERIQDASRMILEAICNRTISGEPMTLEGVEAEDLNIDYEIWAAIIESLAAPDVGMIEGVRFTPERFYLDDARASDAALRWYAGQRWPEFPF